MKQLFTLLLPALLIGSRTLAQSYCSPTFTNGCFNWYNQSITVGAIDWTSSGDCTEYDHTDLVATAAPGEALDMSVTSGVWTGCAVWADWDNSASFEESENLYYIYVGGDPGHTYDFSITVPAGTPAGSYRLRVIAPWGSDGFLDSNTNGYGPCGDYQYGNFDDFTLEVSGSDGIGEAALPRLNVWNTGDGNLVVELPGTSGFACELLDANGRTVHSARTAASRLSMGTTSFGPGVYTAVALTAYGRRSVGRLVLP